MNYGFYISKKSSRLTKFLKQEGNLFAKDLKIVISDYPVDPKQKKQFLDFGLEVIEYDYKILPGEHNKEKNLELSNRIMRILDEYSIDYCISFGSHILAGELLEKYKYHLINFHPALLPMFPGRAAVDQAVEHGNVLLVGNTAHFIDDGMDTDRFTGAGGTGDQQVRHLGDICHLGFAGDITTYGKADLRLGVLEFL